MDKNDIIKLLKNKRRGIYLEIVKHYAEEISGIRVSLALEIIREDLERSTGQKVSLSYFSLRKAIYKMIVLEKSVSPSNQLKIKTEKKSKRYEFKDAHESLSDKEMKAGGFEIKD